MENEEEEEKGYSDADHREFALSKHPLGCRRGLEMFL
jgi:hypothetical protein